MREALPTNNLVISKIVTKKAHHHTHLYESAIVTSTSTPGSMVIDVICFTTSGELKRSMTLL